MRVLVVSHYFESHRGGIEIVAGKLVRELRALGINCCWAASAIASAPAPADLQCTGLAVSNAVEGWSGLPIPILKPAGWKALSHQVALADAVIVNDALYTMSVAALLAARRRRIPVMLIQHIGVVPFSNPILRLMMATADRVIVRPVLAASNQCVFISDTVRRHFGSLNYRAEPTTIFNGVDPAIFRIANSVERSELCRDLGLSDERRTALFVGRFVEKKGLSAIREAALRAPETDFLLAGWGAIDPERWGLANVRVLRGLSGSTLADVYRAADVLILPSVGEGFPLVVQEALACGLRVITGRDTANADPEATIWLDAIEVDPSDPVITGERLANAVAKVTRFAGSAAIARSEFARERYSWVATAKRYSELLTSLADATASGAVVNMLKLS